jgi:hypothetical protein
MEVDSPLEDKVSNTSESIQGFHMKIVYLGVSTMPSAPRKEREKMEKTPKIIAESIKILGECSKLYE